MPILSNPLLGWGESLGMSTTTCTPPGLHNVLVAWLWPPPKLMSTDMRPVGWLVPSDSEQFSSVSEVFPFLFISFSFVPKSRSSLVLLGLSFSSSLLRHSPSIATCVLSNSVPCLGINWHNLLKLNFPVIGKPLASPVGKIFCCGWQLCMVLRILAGVFYLTRR